MKESTVPSRSALTRMPLATALLLSACLHLAAFALIQPAPGSDAPRTLVISARLEIPAQPAAQAPETSEVSGFEPARPLAATSEPAIMLAGPQPGPEPLAVAPAPAAEPPAAASVPTPAPAASASPAASPAPVRQSSVGPPLASTLPALPLGVDTTWYQARQVDIQPRAVGRIEPVYPDAARRRNQEGSLRLMVKIDDLGRVLSAEVVEANPPGVFDEAALEAFRKARFQPAMKDGRPVRFQAYMRVDFKLED